MKNRKEKFLEESTTMELSDDALESVVGGRTKVFLYKIESSGIFNYTNLSVDMDMSVDELVMQYKKGFSDIPKNVQIIFITKQGVPMYRFDNIARIYQENGYTLVERS